MNSADCAIGYEAAHMVLSGMEGFMEDYRQLQIHRAQPGGTGDDAPLQILVKTFHRKLRPVGRRCERAGSVQSGGQPGAVCEG